jgi:hypothetical protein
MLGKVSAEKLLVLRFLKVFSTYLKQADRRIAAAAQPIHPADT